MEPIHLIGGYRLALLNNNRPLNRGKDKDDGSRDWDNSVPQDMSARMEFIFSLHFVLSYLSISIELCVSLTVRPMVLVSHCWTYSFRKPSGGRHML